MKKIVKITIVSCTAVIFSLFAAPARGQKAAELPAVASVDLTRYAGRWFEIAKYPNKFQKQCVANTTATYSIKPDGKLRVVNECQKSDGSLRSATGEAKVVEGSNNAKLKVRFAPAFLSFLSAVWGNYWVIDLDPGYQYAVIGEPEREYLWILSRKPELDEETYQRLLKGVETMGFVPARPERTPQNTGVKKDTKVGSR